MDKALAESIRKLADGCCEYCPLPQLCDPLTFQIDHIIARQHGGTTTADNLALACFACNHHKGPNIAGFDSDTQEVVPLFHPRREVWTNHFRWQGPELFGQTPTGRATVHVLAVNRDYRIALRRALILEGEFPPRR